MRIFTKSLVALCLMLFACTMCFAANPDDVDKIVGTYHFKSLDYTKGEDSPHGVTYANKYYMTIEKYEGPQDADVQILGWAGVETCKALGAIDENGVITVKNVGNYYTSAYEGVVNGKSTESLGDADGTIAGKITLTPDGNGGFTISKFTVVNTSASIGEAGLVFKNDLLYTYVDNSIVPVKTLHFKPATFTKGEDSPHGLEYAEEFDLNFYRYVGPNDYAYEIQGWGGMPNSTASTTTVDENGVITIKQLGNCYTSAYYGMMNGNSTESLGDADGKTAGTITLTPDGKGGYSVSKFTIVDGSVTLGASGPVFNYRLLATYEGGVIKGDEIEDPIAPVESIYGTYHFKSLDYTKGEDSPHGVTYANKYYMTIEKYEGPQDADVQILGWAGVETCKALGAIDENGVITVKNVGNYYTSAYEGVVNGKSTESLGDADGTIAGKITLTPDGNGGFTISKFTVVNTSASIGEAGLVFKNDLLYTYVDNSIVPVKTLHFKPATFTKGEDSPHGLEYAEEFDLNFYRYVGPNDYAYEIQGWGGMPNSTASTTTVDENGVITIKQLGNCYTSAYYGMMNGNSTESLGDADGKTAGTITLTPDGKGGYSVSKFTVVDGSVTLGASGPVFNYRLLATYEGGEISEKVDDDPSSIIVDTTASSITDGIYTIGGNIIRNTNISTLSRGLYIVKSGKTVRKIFVK